MNKLKNYMMGMKIILLGGVLVFTVSSAHAGSFKCIFQVNFNQVAPTCALDTSEQTICQQEFGNDLLAACVGYQGTVAGVVKEGVQCGFYRKSTGGGKFLPKDFRNPYSNTPPIYVFSNREFITRSFMEVGKAQPGFIASQYMDNNPQRTLGVTCQR